MFPWSFGSGTYFFFNNCIILLLAVLVFVAVWAFL